MYECSLIWIFKCKGEEIISDVVRHFCGQPKKEQTAALRKPYMSWVCY
jgi:hypothetical protein